ncbi:extracellular solute-binding protein [Paenibacillus flagellatus]|uniref:ABC transporter substrate-binding protein n=1 Tax=Paenibacillus flagellatus TaxID=2211139 RepID=A0A2V5KEF0_9BACL|nr:extracellular solute-binding protein [Paenibacillus flagellatus]PYI57472.1 ABC transporter substrate-binding protein [Paenibacillus flagellatus]
MRNNKWGLSASAAILLTAGVVGCSSGDGDGGNGTDPGTAQKIEKVYVYANFGNLANTNTVSKPEAVEEVKKVVMDKIGIEIVPIIPPKGSEADKLNVLLGSNEPLDIFAGSMAVHQANGAARPIGDLLDRYGANIRKLWPEQWKQSWDALTTADGRIWAIPTGAPVAGNGVLVREDWLAKLGLSMPKTIDEYEAVLKAFKDRDPAGSGQTIPLLTDLASLHGGFAAGFMDTGFGNWVDKDGKVKPPQLHPGYRDFLAKMSDWYKKGYMFKEAFSSNRTRQIELVKQNRVASGIVWNTTITANEHLLRQNVPEAKYAVAAELKGPNGNLTTLGGVSTGGIMINKNAKNPEAAVKLIDWVHADIENYFTLFFGIEGKHWKYADKAKRIIEGLNTDYMGDLVPGLTFAYTVQYEKNDPSFGPQFDFIRNYLTDMKRVKTSALADVEYKFDTKALNDKVPTSGDIARMIEQETIKFITGARPMGEYDKFVDELYKAGLDKWIEAYTAEYNRVKGK